jgi:hypothetical protein
VRPYRPCVSVDDQLSVVDRFFWQLARGDEVVHVRIAGTEPTLQLTQQFIQLLPLGQCGACW